MSCSGEEVASADTELHPTPQDQDRTRVGQQQQVVESVHSDGASTASTHWQHTDLNDARSESAQSCGSRSEHDEPNDTVSDGGTLCVDNDHSDSDFEFGSDDEDAFDFFSGQVPGTSHDTNSEDDFGLENGCRPPLDVNHIRVVYILSPSPGTEEIIRCHFERTSLLEPCEYFALSYAWGTTTTADETILIDDVSFPVTTNLLAALYKLRAAGSWISAVCIDAICIDQDNPIERSRQVMLIGQIYSKAKHLIIWLGELDNETPPVPEWMIKSLVSHTHRGLLVDEVMSKEASDANRMMRQRAYFSRRWVVQEVLRCAKPYTILVGDYRLLATNVADVLEDQERALEFVHPGHERPAFASDGEPIHDQQQENRSLFSNLIDFASKSCSDDRDIVYALRSISKDGRYLAVNYTKDATSIYVDLARSWIAAGHLKAVLQFAILQKLRLGRHRGSASDSTTESVRIGPSWVPNWNAPSTTISRFETPNYPFRAGLRSRSLLDIGEPELQPLFREQGCRLSLMESGGNYLRCQGRVFAQCKHYPTRSTGFRRADVDCDYCVLFDMMLLPENVLKSEASRLPKGGTWCVLTQSSIAFGVDLSNQRDDVTEKQAYVLRTPIYDVTIENQALYDSTFANPSVITLV